MNSNRFDIYKEVHKGVRKALFDLATLSGSTDFHNLESLQNLKAQFGRTYNLLETHAHSEDTYVEPLVQECEPETASALSKTHAALEVDISTLQKQLNGIDGSQDEAITQGRSFYLGLTRFIGAYLQHIADEEQIVQPLLWDKFSDSKLMETSIEIRANIPPPVMGNFLNCMIPAMNHGERVSMLSGMKQAAPPEVFSGVCKLAEGLLSKDDWASLEQSIN